MDLERISNIVSGWTPHDKRVYGSDGGRAMLSEYKFIKGMRNWEMDEDRWIYDPLKVILQAPKQPILIQLEEGYIVLPAWVKNVIQYVGKLQSDRVTRWRFLKNPHKNNIIFYLETGQKKEAVIDREILCQINLNGDIEKIMESLRSQWRNASDTITYSDMRRKTSQSVYQLSINCSKLQKLTLNRFESL